jgi:hypothetical protein
MNHIFKTGDIVKVINLDDENGNYGKYFRIDALVDKKQYGTGMTGYFYIVRGYFGEYSYISEELEKAIGLPNAGLLISNPHETVN